MTEHSPEASLCLVVPCYNEANRFPAARVLEWMSSAPSARILFVDDGSRDNTLQILRQISAGREDRAAVLALPANRGKAEAVRAGILYALREYHPSFVGFWDADLATPLDAVDRFMTVLERRPEIEMVFGARVQLLGRQVQRNPARHYLGRIFATTVSTLLRLPIYDTQCGAKIFRVLPHTEGLFADPFLSKWVFDVEILARYMKYYRRDPKHLERAIYEYPLETWIDVAGSQVKPTDFFVSLRDVFRIYRRYLS